MTPLEQAARVRIAAASTTSPLSPCRCCAALPALLVAPGERSEGARGATGDAADLCYVVGAYPDAVRADRYARAGAHADGNAPPNGNPIYDAYADCDSAAATALCVAAGSQKVENYDCQPSQGHDRAGLV